MKKTTLIGDFYRYKQNKFRVLLYDLSQQQQQLEDNKNRKLTQLIYMMFIHHKGRRNTTTKKLKLKCAKVK